MSLNPFHLQLLSIKLDNIPPIVQLPALSGRPRPVSKTCPTHNHTGEREKGGEVGVMGRSGRSRRWSTRRRRRRRRRRESAEMRREIEKWQVAMQ